jgi:hypothetical protein
LRESTTLPLLETGQKLRTGNNRLPVHGCEERRENAGIPTASFGTS